MRTTHEYIAQHRISFVLAPLLIALLWLPFQCAAETVVYRFDDELGSDFFPYNPTGLFAIQVANGVLRISKPSDGYSNVLRKAEVGSILTLQGDFDTSVEYSLNSPLADGDQLEFHLYGSTVSWFLVRSNEGWIGGNNYHVWLPQLETVTPQILTSDTSGTLRFVRTGATLSAYFRSGVSAGDTLVHSGTFETGVVQVAMTLQSQSQSHSALDAAFDNLNLTANSIVFPIKDAPAHLMASDGRFTNKIALAWSAVSEATSYQVWRSMIDDSSSANRLTTTTYTAYDDTSATPGLIWHYWVKAVNGFGTSGFSASDSGYAALTIGPIIKANGTVGDVTVNYPDAMAITIEMNEDPYGGAPVDWWVVALAGSSWYYLNSSVQWTQFDGNLSHCHPVHQGGLFNLPATPVLSITGLPKGSYTFWFAVDQMDGILNEDGPILVDAVNVTVQ